MHVESYKHIRGAHTLPASAIGFHQKSGWTVTGRIVDDYYRWVNDFEAYHPALGTVAGNFQTEVTADTKYAFDDFLTHFKPQSWDYGDI